MTLNTLVRRVKDFLNANSSIYVYLKSLNYKKTFDLKNIIASFKWV